MCKNQQHIDMVEQFYNNIVEALKRAASEVLTNSPKQQHNVPGWNKDVREKHKAARRAYLYWIDNHKPKSGPLFDITKESKKEFKYALRACQKSQQKCKADAIARGAARMRPKRPCPPPKKLVKIFRWCFVSISTVRKQTEGTVGLT